MNAAPSSTPTLAPELAAAVHHLPASDTAAPHCLNCGAEVPGHFCGHCGQDRHTHRFTVAHVLHELPHTILHVDKGLPYSIRQLLLRPADMLRGYLAGQRQPHFRPLAYVLLIAGVASFLFLALHIQPYDAHDPRYTPAMRLLADRFAAFTGKYVGWFTVGALPFTALVTRFMLRRLQLNYAEAFVVNAYIAGTVSLLSMPFMLLMYPVSGTPLVQTVSLVSSLVMLAYQSWVFGSLLKPTGRSALRRYLRGMVTAAMAYGVLMVIMFAVLFSANWPLVKQAAREQTQLVHQKARQASPAPAAH